LNTVQSGSQGPENLALRFIEGHRVMTVAVCDSQGMPWAAPVFYVNDGFGLYWLTNPGSRLGTCLATNPRAAIAILDGSGPSHAVRGLQMWGNVCRIDSWGEYVRCARRFLRRFPGLAADIMSSSAGSPIRRKAASTRFYRLAPDRCWFTDHSQGFGSRMEMDLRNATNGP
jgi:hypothetical protein